MEQNKKLILVATAVVVLIGAFLGYRTFGNGTLVVEMTDPPRDWGQATNVYIKYSSVDIHRADAGNQTGWIKAVDSEAWMDLTDTLNSSKTLGTKSLQAGKYNLVRFEIMEAVVTINGANYTASVASGKLNIAIIQGGVTINAGQTSSLLIDITPKITGSETQGYRLTPAAKALPN
ncbi:MAG: DUF4382 domain-containing protein [Candidatus Bathyarchaeota archaeon]